ncbi:hypothetical protein [Nonomuraea solani]|uniref:hypothetical protein n=1 Tax=Nonomuraea solani TaxID=1144553 RepID=UPI0011B06A1C|nr:hypothetical protein [Nonomuraea solani]
MRVTSSAFTPHSYRKKISPFLPDRRGGQDRLAGRSRRIGGGHFHPVETPGATYFGRYGSVASAAIRPIGSSF